jgi:hypothetical protein
VIQLDGEGIIAKLMDAAKALARASTLDMILEAVSLILDLVAYYSQSVGTAVTAQLVSITEASAELYHSRGAMEEAGNDATEIAEIWQKRYSSIGKVLAAVASLIVSATGHVTVGVLVSQFGGRALSLIGRAVGTPAVYRAESGQQALLGSV